MAVEEEITADYILKHRRSRWWASGAEKQDMESITVASPKEVTKAAGARFGEACDSGVWKRLTSVLLEPANPFDPKAPRRFRREAVVLGGMLLSFLLLALYFNLGGR
jgi:hypothetical protein